MKQDLVSIIIVNYNGKKWLKKCFDSLLCQSYTQFEIILVDNRSSDDSVEFVETNYPRVKIIKSEKNLGFAGGNNLGINAAQGEYILMLNNDTWVESDFLYRALRFFKGNNYDVISFLESNYEKSKLKISNFKNSIDPFGYTIPLPRKDNSEPFHLCGFCLLFKRDLYLETGGLDDNFFMYIEEIDWFWRLRLFRKSVWLCEEIAVCHAGSGTIGNSGFHYNTFLWRNQNTLQMLIKNYTWYNLSWVLPIYIILNIFEMLFFLVLLQPKIALTYIEGWKFVLSNLGKILEKRKWVQEKRIASDGEIMKKYFYCGFAKFNHLLVYYKK